VFVDACDVAGVELALVVEHRLRLFREVVVPFEDARTAERDLAGRRILIIEVDLLIGLGRELVVRDARLPCLWVGDLDVDAGSSGPIQPADLRTPRAGSTVPAGPVSVMPQPSVIGTPHASSMVRRVSSASGAAAQMTSVSDDVS